MKPSVAAAILGERSMMGDSALLYGTREVLCVVVAYATGERE